MHLGSSPLVGHRTKVLYLAHAISRSIVGFVAQAPDGLQQYSTARTSVLVLSPVLLASPQVRLLVISIAQCILVARYRELAPSLKCTWFDIALLNIVYILLTVLS